jgi:ABC-2 type transport system permease protein
MSLTSGSLAWLITHELTLNWRRFESMFGRLTPGSMWSACLAGTIVLHLLAWPIIVWLAHRFPADAGPPVGAIPIVCVLAWMSAQGLLGTAHTLQERGSLELLLASPLPMHLIVASRLISIAASTFASVALLLLPVANMGAILHGPAWLAVYPTLIGLALVGTVVGMAVAIGLFSCLVAQRARLISQLCAACMGGAFVLAMQFLAVLPAGMRSAIGATLARCAAVAPLRPLVAAAHGELVSMIGFTAFAATLFSAAAILLSESFVRASLRAATSPTDMGTNRTSDHGSTQFGSSVAKTMRRKEWRLLVRDQSVFAQLALQIIYTAPLAVVLLRGVDIPLATAMSPTIVVIAAQIAASLAWITVSGEDAPELIASAPVHRQEVEVAKITAIGAPVLFILALPLVGLALLAPAMALLVVLFAGAAGSSTALLNLWHPMPGNRRGMLRRHSQSKLMALLEHSFALLWAVAIFLAVLGSTWAILPIALVMLTLALLRPPGGLAGGAQRRERSAAGIRRMPPARSAMPRAASAWLRTRP